MLKSIDPRLNADVLHALRAMGHGDELVLCDTNFPADFVARATVLGKLLSTYSGAWQTMKLRLVGSLLQNRALSCGTGPLGYGWRV